MASQLKIIAMTVDGCPYGCPTCGTDTFSLEAHGLVDAIATVWGNCVNYHSWEDFLLTPGDLDAIQAASSGRARAEDDDTFEVVIGGALLAGILHPELTADDLKKAARFHWQRIIKPAIRKQRQRAVRGVTRPVKNAAKNTVAHAKAAALETAWGLQAGGHQPDPGYTPDPVNACPFCTEGFIKLDTHLHDTTSVRCTVCTGTGEID
ncbi:hypothetical protein [Streptomyces sp. NPDC093223]|uniref:hypothetical protein n=1 Tax=Streptomyces sp. NPDC093223 TaxID=3366033 RepID=UPI0037FE12D9